MSINGVSPNTFRRVPITVLIVFGWLMNAEIGRAQSMFEPAIPTARPYGIVGPMASPYGLAPMPIGPAPYSSAYGPPIAPWPAAYPPLAYAGPPSYWGRPATPFDATGSVYPQTPRFETQRFSRQAIESPSVPASSGNLRLTISETFLNRLIARTEQKPGEAVRDFILGADVQGRQTTETKLRFDLLPSTDKMRGVLVLNGITQAQTTGITPQAMVDVASQQQFVATKELYFDGLSLSTRHAVVHVQAKNQTLGAKTPLSGTLIGGIADRIAYREAERRKPAAEAIARDRVAERVFPEFDQEIDKQLATANDELEGTVRRKLREFNLMPSRQHVFSTDTYVSYSAQMAEELPMASTTALENQFNKDDGLCLLVHQSLLHSLIQRSGLKGLKTNDKQIRALFAPYELKPTNYEVEKPLSSIQLPGMEDITTDIEFDESDPIRIRIEPGRTLVTMRATFKPGGQDLLPPLAITIPYETELVGEKIIVTPGSVELALQSDDDSNMAQSLALKLTKQGIEANLVKLAFDRALPANLWPAAGPVPQVTGIRSDDEWSAFYVR
jgi:hypothetical protein